MHTLRFCFSVADGSQGYAQHSQDSRVFMGEIEEAWAKFNPNYKSFFSLMRPDQYVDEDFIPSDVLSLPTCSKYFFVLSFSRMLDFAKLLHEAFQFGDVYAAVLPKGSSIDLVVSTKTKLSRWKQMKFNYTSTNFIEYNKGMNGDKHGTVWKRHGIWRFSDDIPFFIPEVHGCVVRVELIELIKGPILFQSEGFRVFLNRVAYYDVLVEADRCVSIPFYIIMKSAQDAEDLVQAFKTDESSVRFTVLKSQQECLHYWINLRRRQAMQGLFVSHAYPEAKDGRPVQNVAQVQPSLLSQLQSSGDEGSSGWEDDVPTTKAQKPVQAAQIRTVSRLFNAQDYSRYMYKLIFERVGAKPPEMRRQRILQFCLELLKHFENNEAVSKDLHNDCVETRGFVDTLIQASMDLMNLHDSAQNSKLYRDSSKAVQKRMINGHLSAPKFNFLDKLRDIAARKSQHTGWGDSKGISSTSTDGGGWGNLKDSRREENPDEEVGVRISRSNQGMSEKRRSDDSTHFTGDEKRFRPENEEEGLRFSSRSYQRVSEKRRSDSTYVRGEDEKCFRPEKVDEKHQSNRRTENEKGGVWRSSRSGQGRVSERSGSAQTGGSNAIRGRVRR